jgi:hypothetical protein
MSNILKIATWNLRRPSPNSLKRNPVILQQLSEINADIWVLTETNAVITPGDTYFGVASTAQGELPYRSKGENLTTIWSRWAIKKQYTTFAEAIAVCSEIHTPFGDLVVYGTVLPWHADKGPEGTAKNWEEQYKSIPLHGDDWLKLNLAENFCVAGDFNTTLQGPMYYGTKKGRGLLNLELERNKLVCVTDKLKDNIDHICLSTLWSTKVTNVQNWQAFTEAGIAVSDHNGTSIELTFS